MLRALAIAVSLFLPAQQPERSDEQGVVVDLDTTAPDLRDPRSDGWATEVFAEDVSRALAPLKKALKHGANAGLAMTDDATVWVAGPEQRVELHHDAAFTTRRFRASAGAGEEQTSGSIDAFVQAMRAGFAGDAYVKLKVVGVTLAAGAAPTADVLIESGGRCDSFGFDSVAQVTTLWERADGGLRLAGFVECSFESTRLELPGGTLFEDVTAAALAEEPAWAEQLMVGHDRWAKVIEERLGMGLYKHSGAAVGDVDGDGLEDIYVAQPAGLPNLLLLRAPNGGLRNVAKEAAVDWLDHTTSALIVDLDGDLDRDLVTATAGLVIVHENCSEQSGDVPKFKVRARLRSTDTDLYGLSAADVDLDGDLDVYVTADFANKRKGGATGERSRFDYVDANDGGRNVLWRNDGGFAFVDATAPLGLDVHNGRHSLAATWRDVDLDGDVDLYVANDYGHNCLYLSQADRGRERTGPLFVERAAALGVQDRGSGMSIDVGDPNRDGKPDLLVANMWSSAGRRVTPQAAFGAAGSTAEREQYARFAKGNTLFLGGDQSSNGFQEASADANIERGRWAWGTPFVDLDGDGWEDMLVGNGYVTSTDTGDL